jgi:hypothetical protein
VYFGLPGDVPQSLHYVNALYSTTTSQFDYQPCRFRKRRWSHTQPAPRSTEADCAVNGSGGQDCVNAAARTTTPSEIVRITSLRPHSVTSTAPFSCFPCRRMLEGRMRLCGRHCHGRHESRVNSSCLSSDDMSPRSSLCTHTSTLNYSRSLYYASPIQKRASCGGLQAASASHHTARQQPWGSCAINWHMRNIL